MRRSSSSHYRGRARDNCRSLALGMTESRSKSTSPLKPKEGLNGAPVNQTWTGEFVFTNINAGEGARATKN